MSETSCPNGCGPWLSGGCARPYHAESALTAEGLLAGLAAELDKTHPAAGGLREAWPRR